MVSDLKAMMVVAKAKKKKKKLKEHKYSITE